MSGPTPPPGSLVAFWDRDTLCLGVVAGAEKGRLRLVAHAGREVRITPARVTCVVEPGPGPQERGEAGRRVERAETRVGALAAEVDVAVLWELAAEAASQAAPDGFDIAALADLALGSAAGEARVAVMRALRADGLHFRRRGEAWEPRSPQQVDRLRLERARVAEREARTAELFAALAAAVRGDAYRPAGDEHETRYLSALEQLAIHEDAAPASERATALEALEASGLAYDRVHEGAFRLLRILGRFPDEDENLQVRRYGLRTEFPRRVLAAAADAVRRGYPSEDREDLRHLEAISIDSPHTREVDDALSVEPLGPGLDRLGVHIADPAAYVRPGDPVDEEALARALTHYHPDLRLPMLPPELSEAAASLVAGEERPALSFLVDLRSDGSIAAWRIVRSVVRCSAAVDYATADRTLAHATDGPLAGPLARLAQLALAREARRRGAGAVCIDLPEVGVRVIPDGGLFLERLEAGSASRRVVTEAMLLAGRLAAALCVERGLPAIFRRQAPPSTPREVPAEPVSDPVTARRLRRSLPRGETSARPGPHFGLGLEAYAQVTSPLRRFQDLATQRQIGAHLAGEPAPYDAPAVLRIAAITERAEADARRAERAAKEYWILRYLGERTGEVVEAVVVATEPGPVVQLGETLWEQPLPSLAGAAPGQRVRLRIERVNPRAGLAVLRRVD